MEQHVTSRWNEQGEVLVTMDAQTAQDLFGVLAGVFTSHTAERVRACLEWTLQRPGNTAESTPSRRTRETPVLSQSGKVRLP